MKWFRANSRHGSGLALFALLVQFALSFGHFHWAAGRIGLSDAGPTYAVGQTALGATGETKQPSNHDDDHQPANACEICTVISLANNFLFASPPLLELPRAVELLFLTIDAEFAHLGSLHTAFQSRAPPAS